MVIISFYFFLKYVYVSKAFLLESTALGPVAKGWQLGKEAGRPAVPFPEQGPGDVPSDAFSSFTGARGGWNESKGTGFVTYMISVSFTQSNTGAFI